MSNTKTVGIIGGMGPMATYDLAEKIVKNTKADRDQDHIHVIIDCNTKIPDRTSAILNGAESPVPELVKSARFLEASGCGVLIMPCNTVHYYHDDVAASVSVPLLDMTMETAKALREKGIKKAGILATEGTVKTGVYEKALEAEGVEWFYPAEENQKTITDIIYNYVKAGRLGFNELMGEGSEASPIKRLLEEMESSGAEALVMACTELPIAFRIICDNQSLAYRGENLEKSLIDPSDLLARAAILWAGGTLI